MKKFKVTVQVEIEVEAVDIETAHAAARTIRASFDYGYGTLQGKTGYYSAHGVYLNVLSEKVIVKDTEVTK